MKVFFLFMITLCSYQLTVAQSINFEELIAQSQLSIAQPVERQFREQKPIKNDYVNYQYTLRSRKTGLVVRYLVQPTSSDGTQEAPHVTAIVQAMNAASNEEEGLIVTEAITTTTLQEKYHADWGSIYRFPPKRGFSDKSHCTMLALFATEKATVYIFFLYNKMTDRVQGEMDNLMGLVSFMKS